MTGERAVFTRSADLPGVETLTARYVTHRFLPHTHDELVLGVIEGGAESFRLRGERVVAPAGSVVVVPPGEIHTGEAADAQGWAYRVLYLRASWLEEGGAVDFREGSLPDPVLAALVRRAQVAMTDPQAPALARETLLRRALTHLTQHHSGARTALHANVPDAVREARALLDAHPEAPVRAGFADQAHLTRVFKRVVGVPPGSYRRRQAGS